MLIAVTNQSTLVKNDEVNFMCQGAQKQLHLHVLPAYNLKDIKIKFYDQESKIPGYAWTINIVDDVTQANALGYHSEENGLIKAVIFSKIILDNGGGILNSKNNFTISSVLSHEVIEMIGDRYANSWVDGPTIPQGNEYAFELCDPVEGDSYIVKINDTDILVSNFVFPAWFNPQATDKLNMPFDYLKKLKAPFTMSAGGYMIVRKTGRVSQVFDKKMPDWKKSLKKMKNKRKPRKISKRFLGVF